MRGGRYWLCKYIITTLQEVEIYLIIYGLFIYFRVLNILDINKINNLIIFISSIILLICNINFTIEYLLFDEKNENNEQYNKIFMKYWSRTISWIKLNKLKNIYSFTKYFNEIFVIMYFVLIMLYIHYK